MFSYREWSGGDKGKYSHQVSRLPKRECKKVGAISFYYDYISSFWCNRHGGVLKDRDSLKKNSCDMVKVDLK